MSFYAYVHVRPGADAHGVFYVGKGRGRRAHEFSRRNKYHQRVIDKHGADSVEVGRFDCSDEGTAFALERGLIACLKRMGVELTNITDGGEGVSGLRHSDAARKKMSATRKGRKHRAATKAKMTESRKGEKNAFFGRKHSDETKRRISEAKKANPTDYWAGKTRSEEVRKKISTSLKGKTLGRKMSEEARANMSAAQKLVKKRPPTAETRARLSAAIKESWRKRKQINGDSQ
jgi:hypothetical protein